MGGGPVVWVLGQASPDQRPQFARHPAQACRAVDHPVHERGVRPGTERPMAGGSEGEDSPEAEHVARWPYLGTQNLFRGHERGRADHEVRAERCACVSGPGNPEVDDPRSVFGQQDIGGLQVAVHHSRGVDGAQAFRQPGGQGQQAGDGQRSVTAYRLPQRGTRDVHGGQPRHRTVQVRVEDERSEQAAYPSGRRNLTPEARPEFGILGQFGPDDLDRDRPAPRRHAQEHLAHATPAELPQQPIGPDLTRVLGLQPRVLQCPPQISARLFRWYIGQ